MISDGSTVRISYRLLVEGEEIDGTGEDNPLTYVQGAGEIIQGLEEHLAGLTEGDTTTLVVPPHKGYGERSAEAIQTVPREFFPNPDRLTAGSSVEVHLKGEESAVAKVIEVGEDKVTLDFNHPLAGKTLEFHVKITEVIVPK